MPSRPPKMFFCIFGFQRFVWCPKCTPASSNSFIVNAAMSPPPVCPRRATASDTPRTAGTRPRHGPRRARPPTGRRAACVMWLRRVLAVDPDVLLAQVTGQDALLAAAEAQVDRDRVLRPRHDLAQAVEPRALAEHPALDEPLPARTHGR